nr:PREDICTED: double-stranded RNA-binding protein Staufen homolog 2 isoform X2 [Bemisia tabaci]
MEDVLRLRMEPQYQIYKGSSTNTVGLLLIVYFLFSTFECSALTLSQNDFDKIKHFFDANGCMQGTLTAEVMAPPVTTSGSQSPPVTKVLLDDKTTEKCYAPSSQATVPLNKEKTPMCLVNELARFNNIQHEYRLTDETGLAHKKVFNVTLKLGTEEYSAQGSRIRQAQHAAAEIALKETKYKPPVAKNKKIQPKSHEVTPIFELNSLAMRRGEPTVYQYLSAPPDKPHQPRPRQTNWMYNGPYKYSQPRKFMFHHDPNAFSVSVKVGDREFIGTGPTSTAAKRAAALKALNELKKLPISENKPEISNSNGVSKEIDSAAELKSPISLVYELALKRNLEVVFDTVEEKGPPHMRIFVTKCHVGDAFETVGEGNSKKASKKKAAEKMLEDLKKLPITTTINPSGFVVKKKSTNNKKKRNLIKEHKTDEQDNTEANPVSKLIQLQQARKEREPVFILKHERSMGAYKREFSMEVSVGDVSEIGVGPTKKLAKRNAAKKLLLKLGQVPTAPVRPIKNDDKVLSQDATPSISDKTSGGRQLAPGLLLVPKSEGNKITHNNNFKQNLESLAQDYLYKSGDTGEDCDAIRPTEKLNYLSQLLGFKVQYTDFAKTSQNDVPVLSLVSLTTTPPQVCHGQALTRESSHDLAAANALRALADMGLDSIVPNKKESSVGPGGDNLLGLVNDNVPFMNMNGIPK